jgi:hypothetical protein
MKNMENNGHEYSRTCICSDCGEQKAERQMELMFDRHRAYQEEYGRNF